MRTEALGELPLPPPLERLLSCHIRPWFVVGFVGGNPILQPPPTKN